MMTQGQIQKYEGEDRRWFTRFRANFPVKVKDVESNLEKEVTLRDVSARGVGVLSQEKLTPEKKVEITLGIPDTHEPLCVKGQVVWLRITERGEYRAGIKFDRINLVSLSRIFRLSSG